MTCGDIRAQLSAFIDAALPSVQHAEVAAHVQHCAACAREVAALQQAVQQLQQLRVTDTPDLLPGVRRKLSARPGWRGIALPTFHVPMPALALATSLLLVVIAVRVIPWRQELREYQSPASEPVTLGGGGLVESKKEQSRLDQGSGKDANEAGDKLNLSSPEKVLRKNGALNLIIGAGAAGVREKVDPGMKVPKNALRDTGSFNGRLDEDAVNRYALTAGSPQRQRAAAGLENDARFEQEALFEMVTRLEALLSPAEELQPWQLGVDEAAWYALDQALQRVRARYSAP